jgi:hypothetical protein
VPTDMVGKKVAVSVLFDSVNIEIICGDDYLAQVLYDDLIDRLRSGKGITLALGQANAPDMTEDRGRQ